MPRTIRFEGRTITVPDDFNDEEISSVLGQSQAAPAPTGPKEVGQQIVIGPDGRPTARPDIGNSITPADPRTFEGKGTASRGFKVGLQGLGQGAAELIGAPTDLAVAGSNLVTHGINKFTGTEIPAIPPLPGGSERLSAAASNVAQKLGYEPVVPTGMRENIGYEANRFLGNVVGTKGVIASLPGRTEAQIAPRLTGTRTQPPTVVENMQRNAGQSSVKTALGDAVGAAGAGTAVAGYHESGARDVVHNMPGGSVIGPVADAVVPMLGGVAGGTAAPMIAAPFKGAEKGVRYLYDKATGQTVPLDKPVDPVTGRPHTNANLDKAGLIMQDSASNPTRAADEIQTTREALVPNSVSGRELPPATAMTTDPGVASLGAEMKRTNPVPHLENEQQVNTAARRNLDQAVPPGSDPYQFPQRVGEVADRRIARAQEGVTTAEENARVAQNVRQGQAADLPPEPNQSRVQASEALDRQIVEHSLNPMDAEKARRYGAVPNTPVPSDPLHQLAADIRTRHRGLPPNTRAQVVPESVLSDIDSLAIRDPEGNVTGYRPIGLQDLNQINSNIGAQIAEARASNSPPGLIDNLRRVQGRIREMVDQHPDAAEATRHYAEDYGPVWGRSAGEAYDFRQDVNKDRLNRTASPPSETAKRFMGANAPEKTDALQGIVDTLPGPNQTQTHAEIRNYLLSDMAASGAVAADGTLRPMAMQRWADRNAANLDLAPGVRDEINQYVQRARQGEQVAGHFDNELRGARANLRQTEEQINRGAFRNVIGADPEHAVHAIFNSSNPEAAVQELLGALGPHFVEARNGLKAAVRDYMLERGTPKLGQAIEGGAKPISFERLDQTFEQHRNTLRHIFSPEEMHSLEVARQFLAPFRNLDIPGTTANVKNAAMSEETWRMVEAGMKIRYGMLKGGGITRTLKTAASAILPKENAGVKAILEQMQFDPELAAHLLTRDVSEVNSPMWTKRLFQLMGVEEAARDSNRDERRK